MTSSDSCGAAFGVFGFAFLIVKVIKYGVYSYKKHQAYQQYLLVNSQKTKEQFAQEFAEHYRNYIITYQQGMTSDVQKKVLAEHGLYRFPGFREYIKTLPEYRNYLLDLYMEVKNAGVDKVPPQAQQFSGKEFYDIVCALHDEEFGPPRPRPQKIEPQNSQLWDIIQKQLPQLEELLQPSELALVEPEVAQKICEMRKQALQSLEKKPFYQEYKLNAQAEQAFIERGYDPTMFKACEGLSFQQVIHAELVEISNKIASTTVEKEHAGLS